MPLVEPVTTAVVAVSTGEGVRRIFHSLGVQRIVTGGQSMNPSTADHAPGTRPQSSESGAHAHGPVRPIEPHWETVIDRATD